MCSCDGSQYRHTSGGFRQYQHHRPSFLKCCVNSYPPTTPQYAVNPPDSRRLGICIIPISDCPPHRSCVSDRRIPLPDSRWTFGLRPSITSPATPACQSIPRSSRVSSAAESTTEFRYYADRTTLAYSRPEFEIRSGWKKGYLVFAQRKFQPRDPIPVIAQLPVWGIIPSRHYFTGTKIEYVFTNARAEGDIYIY